MKNTILGLIGFMAIPSLIHAQATVSGTWNRRHDGSVKLYRIEHGRLEEIAASKPGVDGKFGFLFFPEKEGFYVIGSGPALTPVDKYSFYFKTKDNLEVAVNDSSYTLTGKNTRENLELEKWHNMVQPLEAKAVYFSKNRSTYVDFFPLLESTIAKINATKFASSKNARFDAEFSRFREMDLLMIACEMLNTPRTAHPQVADYPNYYRSIDGKYFLSDARFMNYAFGVRTMTGMMNTLGRLGVPGYKYSPDLAQRIVPVNNDTLRGEFVVMQAQAAKTYIGLTDIEKNFGKYLMTEDQKIRFNNARIKLAQTATRVGQPALDFTAEDLNGKKVSLSDFKGKVVLVDVWATWCGPCKAEIPHLKKLEKEMHGKDVVFLSVSVDVEKDHQKWKDFVVNEGLTGVQVWANGWSDVTKLYDIKGIPRFMVFDKAGNIVSTDAPRPSNPELKLVLEDQLKK